MDTCLDLTDEFVADFQKLREQFDALQAEHVQAAEELQQLRTQPQASPAAKPAPQPPAASLVELQTAQRELAAATQALDKLRAEHATDAKENVAAGAKLARLQAENQTLHETLAQQAADLAAMRAECDRWQIAAQRPVPPGAPEDRASVESLRAEVQQLRATIKQFPPDWQSFLGQFNNQKIEVEELQKDKERLKKENTALQRDLFLCRNKNK